MTKPRARPIPPADPSTLEGQFNQLRGLAIDLLEADRNLRTAVKKVVDERRRGADAQFLEVLESRRTNAVTSYSLAVIEIEKFLASHPQKSG